MPKENKIEMLIEDLIEMTRKYPGESLIVIGSDSIHHENVKPCDFLRILEYAALGLQSRRLLDDYSGLSKTSEADEIVDDDCCVCGRDIGFEGLETCTACGDFCYPFCKGKHDAKCKLKKPKKAKKTK